MVLLTLFVLLVVGIVMYFLAGRAERARCERQPGTRPYRFGYFLGYALIAFALYTAIGLVANLSAGTLSTFALISLVMASAAAWGVRKRRFFGWVLSFSLAVLFALPMPVVVAMGGPAAGLVLAVPPSVAAMVIAIYGWRRRAELRRGGGDDGPAASAGAPQSGREPSSGEAAPQAGRETFADDAAAGLAPETARSPG